MYREARWLALIGALATAAHPARGQVVTDGSIGPATALVGPNFAVTHDLGQIRGKNLFHSFQTFNINPGETASFSGPSSVGNVLARVTGGNASTIAGTLQCTIPNANFYFINPAGVVFAPGAALDVSGSFVVTTADVIRLADGGSFNAIDPLDNVLTSAPPEAFGFLNRPHGAISVDGLQAFTTKTVSLAGGDVTIASANLALFGGNLNLISVASDGEIRGDLADSAVTPIVDAAALATVSITSGTQIQLLSDFFDQHIGQLRVAAKDMNVDGGSLLAIFAADSDAVLPSVQMDLSGTLSVADGANFNIGAMGAGRAGDIHIKADRVSIASSAEATAGINSFSFAAGPTGAIQIDAHQIDIGPGGQLLTAAGSQTPASGAAGDISLFADTITVAGRMALVSSHSFSSAAHSGLVQVQAGQLNVREGGIISNGADVAGLSGDLLVSAPHLTLSGSNASIRCGGGVTAGQRGLVIDAIDILIANRASIGADTFIDAPGGKIDITCDTLTMRGGAIQANPLPGVSGSAGEIDIAASRQIIMQNDAESPPKGSDIFADSFGSGRGGKIQIDTPLLTLSGNSSIGTTTASGDPATGGNGGDVLLTVSELRMSGTSLLSSATIASGDGGTVTVNADRVIFSESAGIKSPSIGSQDPDFANNDAGTGGRVELHAGSLVFAGGGFISTTTASGGNAGDIFIDVKTLDIRGTGKLRDRIGIFSRSQPNPARDPATHPQDSYGQGGNINIVVATAATLSRAGSISAESSTTGDAGSVAITADDLSLTRNSLIATSGGDQANGGTIALSIARALRLDQSQITATAASGAVQKNGGNMTFSVGEIVYLRDSTLTAEAGNNGGNITIDPQAVVLQRSKITANAIAGNGGNISITTNTFIPSQDSTVTASSTFGLAGTIAINSPNQDLAAALVAPPAVIADPARLQELCGIRLDADVSSFLVTGRGGLPDEPAVTVPDLKLR